MQKSPLRIVLCTLTAFLLLLALAGGLIAFTAFHDGTRTYVLKQLDEHTTWNIQIVQLDWSWQEGLQLLGFKVIAPDGKKIIAKEIHIQTSITQIVSGTIDRIIIVSPRIELKSSKGDSMGIPNLPFSISGFELSDGKISWPDDAKLGSVTVEDIEIEGEALTPTEAHLTFAAETRPGGPLQGEITIGPDIQIILGANRIAAAPLAQLFGNLQLESGIISAQLDVNVQASKIVSLYISVQMDDIRLSNDWRGSASLDANGRESDIAVGVKGSISSPVHQVLPLEASMRGTLTEVGLHLEGLRASLSDLARMEVKGTIGDEIRLTSSLHFNKPHALISWLELMPENMKLTAKLPWKLEAQFTGPTLKPNWKVDAKADLSRVKFDQLKGTGLSGHMQASGLANQLDRATFQIKTAALQLSETKIQKLDWSGTIGQQDNGWQIKPVHLHASVMHVDKTMSPLTWKGMVDIKTKILEASGSLGWAQTQIDTQFSHAVDGEVLWELKTPQQKPVNLTKAIPAPWSFVGLKGRLYGQLKGGVRNKDWHSDYRLNIQDVSMEVPSQQAMLEGLAGNASGKLNGSGEEISKLYSQWQLKAGEYLFGTVYGDMSVEKSKGTVRWSKFSANDWESDIRIQSHNIPDTEMRVTRKQNAYAGRIVISPLKLAEINELYLEDVFSWPIDLAGDLEADITFRWPDIGEPDLAGYVALHNGSMADKKGLWKIGAIDLELPIQSSRKLPSVQLRHSPPAVAASHGLLNLKRISWRSLHWPEILVRPVWLGDKLEITDGLNLKLFGGQLKIDHVRANNIWTATRTFSSAIRLKHMEVSQISDFFSLPGINGKLNAYLSDVSLKNSQLQTRGALTADIFGGQVQLTNMGGNHLFSTVPAISLNANVERLDLGQLTQTFEVGEIQGTLSGSVHDLILVNGEPVSFRAQVSTVEGSVPQRINVKALENMNTLGSGGGSASLQSGIYSLFDNYRYKQLGFRCVLKNDTFYLSGVQEKENGQYLVVGSFLPPTVNVISHSPVIRWRDMIDRLQAIGQTGPAKVK